MIVSLPFSAPAWPPETGASRKPTPLAVAAAWISRAICADAVVWSTRIAPGRIAASAPSAPRTTARTSSSLPTHISTRSAPAAAAAGVGALLPGCCAEPARGRRRRAVVDGDAVPGLREMSGHRIAHHAQAEKCHVPVFHRDSRLHRLQVGERQPRVRRRAPRRAAAIGRAHLRRAPCRRDGRGSRPSLRASAPRRRRRRSRGANDCSSASGSVGELRAARSRRGARRARPLRARRGTARPCGRGSRRGRWPSRSPRRAASRIRAASTSMPPATRSVMIASVSASVSTVSNSGSLSSWLSRL